MHFAGEDIKLAQALCVICEKYGGVALAAKFLLSKIDENHYMVEQQAIEIVKKAGIQVGYSDIVIKMHSMNILAWKVLFTVGWIW